MSNKKLIILGIVTVVMAALAVRLAKLSDRSKKPATGLTYLVQGLDTNLIHTIIVKTGADSVTLRRATRGFIVASKDNYPAWTNQINELLSDVLGIKTAEHITSNAKNHDDLEITEEKAPTIVKFLDDKNKLITGVAVGKPAPAGAAYVRLVGSNDVYLAKYVPYITGSWLNYVERQLIRVDKDDITSVTVTDPNGSYTLLSEPNSAVVSLKDLPKGKKLKKEHQQVFAALMNLRFDDYRDSSNAPNDLLFDHTYRCSLKDSTVYTLQIAASGEKNYIRCIAEFTDKEDITKERFFESKQELKDKEARLLARDAVEFFNRNHNAWIYQIGRHRAKQLTKNLDELLEDDKPEKPNT